MDRYQAGQHGEEGERTERSAVQHEDERETRVTNRK